MPVAELGASDSFCRGIPEVHDVEEKLQCPLVLLVETQPVPKAIAGFPSRSTSEGEGSACRLRGARALGCWASR